MSVRSIFIVSVLAVAAKASAQTTRGTGDTTLKGTTIEVIQAYRPKIKPSPKPEWIPQAPPADTTHPVLSFEVPQQTLYYTYNSLPLKPLALGRTVAKAPFANYVKAGGGNKSTIYLDAGIGGFYGKNYDADIHLHHLSQSSSTLENQQSSLSGLEAEGVYHGKNDIHGLLSVQRNQYNYYGYEHLLFNYPSDSVRQTYTSIHLAGDLANKQDSSSRLAYNPGVNVGYYRAKTNATELSATLNAPVTYKLDSTLDFKVSLNGALAHFSNDSQSLNNNYVAIAPGLALHTGHLYGHVLVGLALGAGNQGYVLPDVLATYMATEKKFTIGLGWKAELKQNTYEQLTTENPYMLQYYPVMQTRSDEIFVNVTVTSGSHLSVTGHISWWHYGNLATYLNQYGAPGDYRKFYIQYLDANALAFGASARYHVADRWSVGAAADLYNFFSITNEYGLSEDHAWHVPGLRLKGDFSLNVSSKLAVTAYLSVLGGIHARDVLGNSVTLSPVSDLGASAEYQLAPRLSAFLQVNNLLNNKYQRWLGYEAYGLNIYGGLRLKF